MLHGSSWSLNLVNVFQTSDLTEFTTPWVSVQILLLCVCVILFVSKAVLCCDVLASLKGSELMQAVKEVKMEDVGVNFFKLVWKKTPGVSGYKISWTPFYGSCRLSYLRHLSHLLLGYMLCLTPVSIIIFFPVSHLPLVFRTSLLCLFRVLFIALFLFLT